MLGGRTGVSCHIGCWCLLCLGLEEKLLQVLKKSGVPLKAPQLAKLCQVPKKEINPVLYQMKKEGKVILEGPATWRLADTESGGSTEQAVPSLGKKL